VNFDVKTISVEFHHL